MDLTTRSYSPVAAGETDQISRLLLNWLRQWPNIPADVDAIRFEYLSDDEVSMALSTIQGAYKIRQYVLGGYEAEYQFKIIYRVKPGNSDVRRLQADEVLNAFADWITDASNRSTLDIGENKRVIRLVSNTRSSLFARYENGDEDHQILLTMTYEVI